MKNIINFIKGIFIGIAVIIPGLSGSIFAVVVGLYDKMLNAINTFRKEPKKNFIFLLPIIIGCAVGVLISTKATLFVTETYKQQSYFFFIGLVLGSIPLVLRKMKKVKFNPLYLILTFLSFFIIMTMTLSITTGNEDTAKSIVAIESIQSVQDVLIIFGAGVFSCSMMAIPGVSGSVMLMVINQYGTVYYAVGKCVDVIKYLLDGNMAAAGEAAQGIIVVLPFLLGAVVGFALIAKILGYLLKKFEGLTYYAVLGLIVGAIFALAHTGVLPELKFNIGIGSLAPLLLIDLVCIVVGVLCTKFLDSPEKN
jgi:putative membrane protein